jgi:hypothetical protein
MSTWACQRSTLTSITPSPLLVNWNQDDKYAPCAKSIPTNPGLAMPDMKKDCPTLTNVTPFFICKYTTLGHQHRPINQVIKHLRKSIPTQMAPTVGNLQPAHKSPGKITRWSQTKLLWKVVNADLGHWHVTAQLGLSLMGNAPTEVTPHTDLPEWSIKFCVKRIQLTIASILESHNVYNIKD